MPRSRHASSVIGPGDVAGVGGGASAVEVTATTSCADTETAWLPHNAISKSRETVSRFRLKSCGIMVLILMASGARVVFFKRFLAISGIVIDSRAALL